LSLGALDFGIIVDGALVMVEHIVHHLARKKERPDGVVAAVRDAALEVERPIFFSLLILISAYLPLFTLERVERRLFTPMAFTVCAALLGSMLITLTVIPVLSTYLFRNNAKGWENPLFAWLYRKYGSVLHWVLPRSRMVVLTSFGIVAVAFAVGATLGSEFLPQLDEGVIWVRANLAPGTALAKSSEIANDMSNLIHPSTEVRNLASQTD